MLNHAARNTGCIRILSEVLVLGKASEHFYVWEICAFMRFFFVGESYKTTYDVLYVMGFYHNREKKS